MIKSNQLSDSKNNRSAIYATHIRKYLISQGLEKLAACVSNAYYIRGVSEVYVILKLVWHEKVMSVGDKAALPRKYFSVNGPNHFIHEIVLYGDNIPNKFNIYIHFNGYTHVMKNNPDYKKTGRIELQKYIDYTKILDEYNIKWGYGSDCMDRIKLTTVYVFRGASNIKSVGFVEYYPIKITNSGVTLIYDNCKWRRGG